MILRLVFLTTLILAPAVAACAGQTQIADYETARKLFWSQLYADGGETLYCEQGFGSDRHRGLNVEHVFPMSWVGYVLKCGRRKQCRKNSEPFNRIEADLHNLYPARREINDARSSYRFAEIPGEPRHFGRCDFEVDERQRLVEPRPASRGEIARAMFYMFDSYDLYLKPRQGQLLLGWHRDDPPSREEHRRNDLIESLQGTRNPFIDDPAQAERLVFGYPGKAKR